MAVTKLDMRRSRGPRRPLLLVVTIVLALVVVCLGLSAYVGWSLTHTKREPLAKTPTDVGLEFESIQFPSRTGDVQLAGWYLPPQGANEKQLTVIFAHGYGKNRLQDDVPALDVAKAVVEAGYGAVLFDFRASGDSGGKLTSVGEFEEQDLLGAYDWTAAHHPGTIGFLGFSMGATTALLAAADEPGVVGVVADSPFAQLRPYLEQNLPVWSHLPSFPFTPLILDIMPPLTGIDPGKVDALAAVDRIYPRPVLFIHGGGDPKIPYANSETMWQKHPDRFQFWKTSANKHVGSYKAEGDAYLQRVLAFIQTW